MKYKYKIKDKVYLIEWGKIAEKEIKGITIKDEKPAYYLSNAYGKNPYFETEISKNQTKIEEEAKKLLSSYKFNLYDLVLFKVEYNKETLGLITSKILTYSKEDDKKYNITYLDSSYGGDLPSSIIKENEILMTLDRKEIDNFEDIGKLILEYYELQKKIGNIAYKIDKKIHNMYQSISEIPNKIRWYHRKSQYVELLKIIKK